MYESFSCEHKQYLKTTRINKRLIMTARVLIIVAFFSLWELAATMRWLDPFIFSQPSRVFAAFINMLRDGSIFIHVGVTLGETIIGFTLSTAGGLLISALLWWNAFLRKVLEPYLVVLNSLPKTALAPVIIVLIGNNINSVIATAVMTSIIVTVLNILTGFLEVSTDKIKLVESFGGTKWQILQKVVLPASVPAIVNALKVSVGLSFVGVIVGEFLVAKAGLGYLIVYGSQVFKMDWVMMSVIILCLLATLLYVVVAAVEKRIVRGA